MRDVFIVGAKSLGSYGGYETFVYKLAEYQQNKADLQYHIACKANGGGHMDESALDHCRRISDTVFYFHNARCVKIHVPELGSASAIYYDIAALKRCCEYIETNHIQNAIVYILACRIGPFAAYFQRRLHRLGAKLYLNPDGHEWKRKKWSLPVRAYWKLSEKLMVKHADLIICDSRCIETYIKDEYHHFAPRSTYISYGCDQTQPNMKLEEFEAYLCSQELHDKDYYLVVGRFVPENNFETILKEFTASKTTKKLAIVTATNYKFMNQLEQNVHFSSDPRIKFLGPIYDQTLLKMLRSHAYGYIHGHEVGGTNPSLLEALGYTDINLIYDVCFNREVAQDAAVYWSKAPMELSRLIEQCDNWDAETRVEFGRKAKKRIMDEYNWPNIIQQYEKRFLCGE